MPWSGQGAGGSRGPALAAQQTLAWVLAWLPISLPTQLRAARRTSSPPATPTALHPTPNKHGPPAHPPTSSVSSVGTGSGVITRTYCSCMAASSMMRPSVAMASAVVMVPMAGGAGVGMAAGKEPTITCWPGMPGAAGMPCSAPALPTPGMLLPALLMLGARPSSARGGTNCSKRAAEGFERQARGRAEVPLARTAKKGQQQEQAARSLGLSTHAPRQRRHPKPGHRPLSWRTHDTASRQPPHTLSCPPSCRARPHPRCALHELLLARGGVARQHGREGEPLVAQVAGRRLVGPVGGAGVQRGRPAGLVSHRCSLRLGQLVGWAAARQSGGLVGEAGVALQLKRPERMLWVLPLLSRHPRRERQRYLAARARRPAGAVPAAAGLAVPRRGRRPQRGLCPILKILGHDPVGIIVQISACPVQPCLAGMPILGTPTTGCQAADQITEMEVCVRMAADAAYLKAKITGLSMTRNE